MHINFNLLLVEDVSQYENYRCTSKTCYWNPDKENVDWGYYQNQTGGCKSCIQACDQDIDCSAVECGSNYCSWWKNSQCRNPDITSDDEDDSTRTCVKIGIYLKNLCFEAFLQFDTLAFK